MKCEILKRAQTKCLELTIGVIMSPGKESSYLPIMSTQHCEQGKNKGQTQWLTPVIPVIPAFRIINKRTWVQANLA
jgi:hypothetical protein